MVRADKPKEYFAKLLGVGDKDIDYSDILPTEKADWENAEVLLPVTAEGISSCQAINRPQAPTHF